MICSCTDRFSKYSVCDAASSPSSTSFSSIGKKPEPFSAKTPRVGTTKSLGPFNSLLSPRATKKCRSGCLRSVQPTCSDSALAPVWILRVRPRVPAVASHHLCRRPEEEVESHHRDRRPEVAESHRHGHRPVLVVGSRPRGHRPVLAVESLPRVPFLSLSSLDRRPSIPS
jgi:hypothetical protein